MRVLLVQGVLYAEGWGAFVDSVVIFSLSGCYTGCTSVSAFVAGGSGKPRVLEQGTAISKILGDRLRTACRPCYDTMSYMRTSLLLVSLYSLKVFFLVGNSKSSSRRVRGRVSRILSNLLSLKFFLLFCLNPCFFVNIYCR